MGNLFSNDFERELLDYYKLNSKALLNIHEIQLYTGWGENSVRDDINKPNCPYVVKCGNRLYANKELLDKYLKAQAGY